MSRRDQAPIIVAEQELGERLGELGLADARGAEEDERAGRPLRVLQASASATDRLGDGLAIESFSGPMTRLCSASSITQKALAVSSSVSL